MDALYIFSLIGSILGAVGTTFIVFRPMKPTGLWIWVVGNGSMLLFTLIMGYYDQMFMWVYYEIINVLGLCKHYRLFRWKERNTYI